MLVEVVGSECCTASFGLRTSASGPSMMDVARDEISEVIGDRSAGPSISTPFKVSKCHVSPVLFAEIRRLADGCS